MRRAWRPAGSWALVGAGLVAGLVSGGIPAALAAANTVPPSKGFTTAVTIGPDDVKPNECDAVTVTQVLFGTGADLDGTSAADLMLGTAGDERLRGRDGNDCVVGGGGDDRVDGDAHDDVLLGGPGDDTLRGGTGTDACHGNDGIDTFSQCEMEAP